MDGEGEDTKFLQAYPAVESVKKAIIDRVEAMNQNLAMAVNYYSKRSEKYKMRPDSEYQRIADVYWGNFQASLLSLYHLLGPSIAVHKKSDDFAALDNCFIDLFAYGKVISKKEWVELSKKMVTFVYELGVTKIEKDMQEEREKSLVFQQ